MGVRDYISQNPVGLAIPSNVYNEEFVEASNISFTNYLEMTKNIMSADHKRAKNNNAN